MRLVFGDDRAVSDWVANRIEEIETFGPCAAIGVADGNRPVAGVVYHEYIEKYKTMQISVAATTPRWAQKGIIYALLSYPFDQVGVRKLWSVVRSGNERALKFNLGLGFKQEGILSRHYGKEHAIVTRMFDKEFHKRYGHVQLAA